MFFKHMYINQATLTPEDVIVNALQDLKHAIKGTTNQKVNKNLEALVKMEEILNTGSTKKIRYICHGW